MSSSPYYYHHEEFQNRNKKLAELRELGVDPYPHKYSPTHSIDSILASYKDKEVGSSEEAGKGTTTNIKVAGRLVLFRAMGKNAFANIQDSGEKIQIMLNRDLTEFEGLNSNQEQRPLKIIEKKIDLGDLVGVEGHLFRTHKGELTIFVKNLTLLAKSLLPLPEKHSGITDKEIRYRKRWLDLISHQEIRDQFCLRSRMVHTLRTFLHKYHFMEVETPILQNIYGGAEARPFLTHINALDEKMYMRISLEIALKKLLVGGMERIYEIGKVFRNEGIDKTHNPEFTMLEAYAAYWDYNDMMCFVENLVEHIALELHGDTKIVYSHTVENEDVVVDVKTPWARLTMNESIQKYAGIEVETMKDNELRHILEKETEVNPQWIAESPRGLLIAALFDEKVCHHLIQPTHIVDHPIETTPLCKSHRNPKKREEGLVERFESFLLGKELCNAYSELNDPHVQRKLLLAQAEKREKGDEEAHPLDEEFLEAICQGMPPSSGVGIGVDRLAMLFTNTPSIRDVLYFPIMRTT